MEDLRDRLAAVERTVTDGEGDLQALADGAATAERVDDLAADVAALRDDVDELSAATQALRGYVGNVRSVNESVEDRADAAVAAVESFQARLEELERTGATDPSADRTADDARGVDRDPATRTGTRSRPRTCEACGRSADGTPPPEGDRQGMDRSGPNPERSPGNDSLAGFDPDAPGEQVRVRRTDGSGMTGGNETERTTDPGLLDPLREVL